MVVDEIWPEHRGNEKSACYGAVMVYSTLDAGPMGLLSPWPYTLLYLSVHPPLWLLAPSSSLQWSLPKLHPSLMRKLRASDIEGYSRAKEREAKGKRNEVEAERDVAELCLQCELDALACRSTHRKHVYSMGRKFYVLYALKYLLIHAHCT